MATLTKANNTTALDLAGAWTPSQIPTASDDLVFDSTYLYATSANIFLGADVTSGSVAFGAVTSPTGALSLAQTGSAGRRLWKSNLFDFSEANANWQQTNANVTLSSAGDEIAIRLGRPYSVSVAIDSLKDLNVSVAGNVDGSASLSVQAGMSMDGYSFYEIPTTADTTAPTVPGTENAVLSTFPNSIFSSNTGGYAVVQGHPTLPTAITLVNNNESRPQTLSFGDQYVGWTITSPVGGVSGTDTVTVGDITYLVTPGNFNTTWGAQAGSVFRPLLLAYNWATKQYEWLGWVRPNATWASAATVAYKIAYDNLGNLYVSGNFSSISDGATTITANRIAKYNIATKTWSNLGTGGFTGSNILALACDASGNLYVGGSFTVVGGLTATNFARWTPSTSTWSTPGAVNAQINGMDIDASNNVHIVGGFSTVGGSSSQRYARWNPGTSTWTRYATGLNNTGTYVTVFGNTAYMAGAFTTAFGVSSTGVVALNTSTGVASSRSLPITTGSVYGLRVTSDGTFFVYWYQSSTAFGLQKWTGAAWSSNLGTPRTASSVMALQKGSGGKLIFLNDSSSLSSQSNLTGVPAYGTAPVGGFNTALTRFDSATNTYEVAPASAGGVAAILTGSSELPAIALYKASNLKGPAPLLHFAGTKTYTVPPGQDVVIQFLNYSTVLATQRMSMFAMVRRGGALLERPEFTTSGQTTLSINSLAARIIGGSGNVTPGVISDAQIDMDSGIVTSVLSTQNRKVANIVARAPVNGTTSNWSMLQLTEDAENLTIGLYGTSGVGIPQTGTRIQIGRVGAFPLGTTSTTVGYPSENIPIGHPNTFPSSLTIGRSGALSVRSPYFKVSSSLTISPSAVLSMGQVGQLNFRDSCVDWDSSTPVLFGNGAREIRVNSFANLPAILGGSFYYTGAGETVTSRLINLGAPGTNLQRFICGPDSGPLNFAMPTSGQRTGPSFNVYNNENNRWTTNSYPLTILTVMGNGTLTMEAFTRIQLYGNPTVTFDFSAFQPEFLPVNQYQAGNFVFKGIPGQDFVLPSTVTGSDTTPRYTRKWSWDANGGTSLSIMQRTTTFGASSNPILMEGLSATNTFYFTSSQPSAAAANPLFASAAGVAGHICILGANGDANYAAAITRFQPIAPYTTYTAMPTSGGTATAIYSQSGSATLTGNVSAEAVKLIPTSSADVLNLSSFTLTPSGLLLTGNQGGTYTIQGTRLTAAQVINTSNTELRILSPVGATNFFGNTVSFGSPTTTYQETTSSTFIATNALTKIYAGSDNLPFIPSTATGTSAALSIVQEMQFLGTGAGAAAFNWSLAFRPGSKASILSNWSAYGLDWATSIGGGSGSAATAHFFMAEIYVDTGVVLTLNTMIAPSVSVSGRFCKTGAGKILFRSLGFDTASYSPLLRSLHYVEAGTIEIGITDFIGPNLDVNIPTVPVQLLAGTSVVLNSAYDHPLNWIIWGDGEIVKNNTNTVRCLARLAQTGGFTVNAGEYDAQFRYAVGDGDVTLAGGTLRASDADKDQYILEVAGDFIFAGGALALGANYV